MLFYHLLSMFISLTKSTKVQNSSNVSLDIFKVSYKMSRANPIACRRSLFQSVHRTTDQDSCLGPCSYTQHYCITWWNLLSLTQSTNVSPSIHRIKRLRLLTYRQKFQHASRSQLKLFAVLAFAKLADILTFAPQRNPKDS